VTVEEGEYPDISLYHLILTCFHCSEPVCIPACPTDCISKRDSDGQVSISSSECIFCGKCQEECPYDAPRFGSEEENPAKLCTLCIERLDIGDKPACVISCPVEALDVAPMDELIEKYGETKQVKDFADPQLTKPNVIFKARGV
jgi:anaerobic dimethyl sulfoxide reductase subunit B (iron-sulfur subunit)